MQKERLRYFAKIAFANLLLFMLIYYPTNRLHSDAYKLYFEWEKNIPLIDWMIIPYLSFNALCVIPLWLLPIDKIHQLGIACAVSTIFAGIVFLIFPAELGFTRYVPTGIFASIYSNLYTIDNPRNLAPSLHVIYSALYLQSCIKMLTSFWTKFLFGGWVAVVMLSTLFTHQHHIMDIITGILVSSIVYYAVSKKFPLDSRQHS